jgi:hypothetical protein
MWVTEEISRHVTFTKNNKTKIREDILRHLLKKNSGMWRIQNCKSMKARNAHTVQSLSYSFGIT